MGDPSEFLDVVSPASGFVLDKRLRHEVHSGGLWHQVFHCLVLRPAQQSVILQRRAASKAAFPLLLDLTVTGHLEAGESPLDGVREFEEELGVSIAAAQLLPLGTRLLADDNGEGLNRELVHVFFAIDDRPLTEYRPPSDEVSGLVEIGIVELLSLLADPALSAPASAISAESPSELLSIRIRRADLVEGADGYWIVLAVMAQRTLAGEPLIAI